MDNTIKQSSAILSTNIKYLKRVSTPAVVKQEIWRQKQIQTYYLDGRPILGHPKNLYWR
jgi:hypothetical protein